jgi:alkylation response protein AidB-like acyl-CoA dehydrogenase
LAQNVTEEALRREHEIGAGLIEELHLAMGAEGWLEPETKSAVDGGFTPIQRRIWDLERRRMHVPLERWGSTMMILQAVRRYARPELLEEVVPGIYDGTIRFAMGYTEPGGGSDIATCRTRARRDGEGWIINGQKMFTSGADTCQYIFLLTNTEPGGPRHRNLTMFLVPGRRRVDDQALAYRLGRAFARIEAAQSTPGIFGRVAIAQTMRDVAPELMDVLGPAAALTADTRGSVAGGGAEYLYRWAPLIGIYGGTIDVFRNMIAQHVLGLGRPNYSPPKKVTR